MHNPSGREEVSAETRCSANEPQNSPAKTETLTGYTKKQARAKMTQREAQFVPGNDTQEHTTVSMLYETFTETKRAGKRAPTTLTGAYARWSLDGKSGRPLSARTVRHVHDPAGC